MWPIQERDLRGLSSPPSSPGLLSLLGAPVNAGGWVEDVSSSACTHNLAECPGWLVVKARTVSRARTADTTAKAVTVDSGVDGETPGDWLG